MNKPVVAPKRKPAAPRPRRSIKLEELIPLEGDVRVVTKAEMSEKSSSPSGPARTAASSSGWGPELTPEGKEVQIALAEFARNQWNSPNFAPGADACVLHNVSDSYKRGSACRDYVINAQVDHMIDPMVLNASGAQVKSSPDKAFSIISASLTNLFQTPGITAKCTPEGVQVHFANGVSNSPFATSLTAMIIRTFLPGGWIHLDEWADVRTVQLYKSKDQHRVLQNNKTFRLSWTGFLAMVPFVAKAYQWNPDWYRAWKNRETPFQNWMQMANHAASAPENSVDMYIWAHSQVTAMATWEYLSNLVRAYEKGRTYKDVPRGDSGLGENVYKGWDHEADAVRAGQRSANDIENVMLTLVPLYHAGIILDNPVEGLDKPVRLAPFFYELARRAS